MRLSILVVGCLLSACQNTETVNTAVNSDDHEYVTERYTQLADECVSGDESSCEASVEFMSKVQLDACIKGDQQSCDTLTTVSNESEVKCAQGHTEYC